MVYVGVFDVNSLELSFLRGLMVKLVVNDHVGDVLDTRIPADRFGLFTYELHPIVIHRIMTRSDHYSTIKFHVGCREIDHLRGAKTDIQNVTTMRIYSFSKGCNER